MSEHPGGTLMFPRNLNDLTPEEVELCIDYLASLPLETLREMQDVVAKQGTMAYALGREPALGNTQIMAEHLTQAVFRKEFGDEIKEEAWLREGEGTVIVFVDA